MAYPLPIFPDYAIFFLYIQPRILRISFRTARAKNERGLYNEYNHT